MKKTILVSADRGETRVAVLESKSKGGKRDVAELYIERRGRRSIVGNIYKGKVDNVLPAWRPPSSTSASSATASCTSTRSCCPTGSRRRSAAAAAANGSTS